MISMDGIIFAGIGDVLIVQIQWGEGWRVVLGTSGVSEGVCGG
jgi:hypothetical protein